MAQIETWLKCDLKKPVKVQYLHGNLFSQDNQANLIGVELYDNGAEVTASGTVTANIIREDGATVTATGSVSGNKASVVLPAAAYAIPGAIAITIKITLSGVITTVGAVVSTVYRSTTDTPVDPGTIMPSIQTLISQIQTAVASIPADYSSLWTSLAPAFSASTNYAAGQYVTNNGKVYRFNTAHTAGAWVASEVTEVKLGNEISDLNAALESTGTLFSDSWERGQINASNGALVNSDYAIRAKYVPVTGYGTKIKVHHRLPDNPDVQYYRIYIAEYTGTTTSTFNGQTTVLKTNDDIDTVTLKDNTTHVCLCIRPYPDGSVTMPLDGYKYVSFFYSDGSVESAVDDAIKTLMGGRDIATYTPHIPAYYPVSGDTFDLSTLPVDTFVYDDYGKFADNFVGTEIEDLGISPTADVRIEKRSANNSGRYYYLLQSGRPKITAIIWDSGITEIFVNRTYLDSKLARIIDIISADDKTTKINDALSIINNTFAYESPMLLKNGDDIVESSDVYDFTDYIKCGNYIGFEIKGSSTRVIAYFYTYNNGSYELTWDVIDYTTSDNKKNYFGLYAYNKVLSIPNPENTYVRYAIAVGKSEDVKVYLWTGEHFGCNIGGSWRHAEVVDDSVTITRDTNNLNVFGAYIPNSVMTLFCNRALIRDVFGFNFVDGTPVGTQLLSTAYLQVYSLPTGYDYYTVNFLLSEENRRTSTGHATGLARTGGVLLNDFVSSIGSFSIYDTTFGKAGKLIEPVQSICSIPWKCKNQTSIYSSGTFWLNKEYAGVPYASEWNSVQFYGWHITRHTFLNAANDKDSKFYQEHGRNGRGTGYSLVCSAFASLVTGCPYPVTTFALLLDPQVQHEFTLQPKVGTIMYKGSEHCILMLELGGGEGYKYYAVAEGINPTASYRINYDFMFDAVSDDNAYNWNYINPYVYSCMHTKATGSPQAYNITDGEIINGSARPYRGDRSVYTSDMDIRINIKSDEAEILYYQKCTYSNGQFTLVGSPMQISITRDPQSVYTRMYIDKETLEDSSFYAVWTDDDDTKEYFEYHVVTTETYSVSQGNMTFSNNDFWYIVLANTPGTANGGLVPKLEDGDYSEYVKAYEISGESSGTMFFKGVLGAYTAPLTPA